MDEFTRKIETAIKRRSLLERGDAALVGLSGGPDSVALLLALAELAPAWDLEILAAHFNHASRGEESDSDEEFCRRLCASLEVPFSSGRASDPPSSNFESWARDARYDFLLAAASRLGASRLAVAHHADDQAETLIINLLRGSGSSGLAGMPPSRRMSGPGGDVTIIRPLIESRREEIIRFLDRRGQDYRTDSSNSDPRLLRNRVRLEVIPLLESINPEASHVLARSAHVLGLESEAVKWAAGETLYQCLKLEGDKVKVRLAPLAGVLPGIRLAVFREAIRHAAGSLRRLGLAHFTAVDDLAVLGPAHGSIDLPGLTVKREYDAIEIVPAGGEREENEVPRAPLEIELPVPGEVVWPGPEGIDYRIRVERAELPTSRPDHSSEAWLDEAFVAGKTRARRRGPGDSFTPRGMEGRRKLKDVMNEMRVPPRMRDDWPIICDDEKILWVPGFRPSGPEPGNKAKALRLSISPPLG